MWLFGLDEPAAADASRAGGKARGLARLRALGLPTPPGFVIATDAPAELPPDLVLARALALPGTGPLVVRSSSTVEDLAALPGIYLTRTGVARGAAVLEAIAEVRASVSAGPPAAMAVIVQPEVPGQRVTLYSRDPARGAAAAEMRIESADASVLVAREGGRILLGEGVLDARAVAELHAAALRIEQALGAPADVEAVVAGAAVTYVQARVALMGAPETRGAGFVAPPGDREWRLDAEHNPAPLSAAQAALVALCSSPAEQVVIEGYLYLARPSEPATAAPGDATARMQELRRRTEAALAPVEARTPDLAAALAAYREVVAAHRALSPALGQPRRALGELLREAAPAHEVPRLVSTLLAGVASAAQERDDALAEAGHALAAGDRARFERLLAGDLGAFAPAWDVAVPSHAEAPAALEATARSLAALDPPAVRRAAAAELAERTAAELEAELPAARRADFAARLGAARDAARMGEEDDVHFARAQQAVRRALLARGQALAGAGALARADEVFELGLDLGGPALASRAAAARAERLRQAALVPPLSLRGQVARYPLPRTGALRGVGGGGRARGPAFVIRDLAELAPGAAGPGRVPPEGAILVLPAVLPAFSHLLARAVGLVTDHGGLLSHGAAQAREYGLATVVGTGSATRKIPDGAEIIVNGETGWVWTRR